MDQSERLGVEQETLGGSRSVSVIQYDGSAAQKINVRLYTVTTYNSFLCCIASYTFTSCHCVRSTFLFVCPNLSTEEDDNDHQDKSGAEKKSRRGYQPVTDNAVQLQQRRRRWGRASTRRAYWAWA